MTTGNIEAGWPGVAALALLAAIEVGAAEAVAASPADGNPPALVGSDPWTTPLPAPTPIAGPEPVVTVMIAPGPEDRSGAVATVNLTGMPLHAPETAASTLPAAPLPAALDPRPAAKRYAHVRPARGATPGKGHHLNKALLSRTARHQMALLAAAEKADDSAPSDLDRGEDAESGADAVDLQVFYKRPEVAKADDHDDGEDISDEMKLLLFMARMRAVAAHQQKHS